MPFQGLEQTTSSTGGFDYAAVFAYCANVGLKVGFKRKTPHQKYDSDAVLLVDLSQLYSNPFLQIRSFKQQIDPQISAHSPEPLTLEDKLETNVNISPKRQNVYGETEVCRIRQKQKTLSEIEIQAVCKRYQSGDSVYKLAEDFKCHRSTISAVLKRNGVEVSHKASTKPELVKRVIEL